MAEMLVTELFYFTIEEHPTSPLHATNMPRYIPAWPTEVTNYLDGFNVGKDPSQVGFALPSQ